MKVRLVYETEIENVDCPTQYDILHMALGNLEKALDSADSNDDLGEVFLKMTVNGRLTHPGFSNCA